MFDRIMAVVNWLFITITFPIGVFSVGLDEAKRIWWDERFWKR